MHLAWISISNIPPLKHVQFNCDERVNLFIGPNGCGKSTILRAIRALYSLGLEYTGESNELSHDLGSPSVAMEASDDWRRITGYENPTKWDDVPLVYVQATRTPLAGRDVLRRTLETHEDESDTPLKDLLHNDTDIFYGSDIEDLIQDARRRTSFDRDIQNQLRTALDLGYSCARQICGEILDESVPQAYIEFDESGKRSKDGRIVHHSMGIRTSDDVLGEPLYAGELSAGTQGTLLWIWAFAIQVMNHHRWAKGWQEKPAILLIDEIENHLHPTWQRRVVPALLEHFPGLQIFATTHSPFVVAGLKTGQVHLLRRDEEGRVVVRTNPEDVVGWTADEILRNMMGVDDPTDKETAEAAEELRQLRNEMPLADEEAEAQRQERMQELRKRVDRDLLAGGPMAAQRERFEEDLAKILEEHRKSRDLNQDNG